jgi:succinate dehydrogenase / fumarate reductase flavoprotein subunit
VWVPKRKGDHRAPSEIPDAERDYFLERKYPSFGNLVPRDVASRNAKQMIDDQRGVGSTGMAVYLDFRDAIARDGEETIRSKYGNLFQMYERITDEDPYRSPMRIYPAVHYTMGGLWVDYNLESTVPGLFVLGEANFSDHGANRLGASALMQGLADGYFVVPYTIGAHLAGRKLPAVGPEHPAFREARARAEERIARLMGIQGRRPVDAFHRELGRVMWDRCGMSRNADGLREGLERLRSLREEFWHDLAIPGTAGDLNAEIERAGRVADFFELGELMMLDALHRNESCGGHFREEYQTEDGEARRDDQNFCYVGAWEHAPDGGESIGAGQWNLHRESLTFEEVHLTQRSYK